MKRTSGDRWAWVVVASVGMVLVGCKPAEQGKGRPSGGPIPVELAAPTTRAVPRTVDVVGTLYGREETTISAKVAGRIEAISADVGDAVAPGEPLLQIETHDYVLSREQKRLAMLETLARLGLSGPPGRDFKPQDVATVKRAQLQADNALLRFQRAEQLITQKPPVISQQDFDDIKTALKVAQSNYEVELLTVASLVTQVEQRAADLEVAQQRLDDTNVRAPLQVPATLPSAATQPTTQPPAAYYVAGRLVSTGEYVREGTPLFRLVDDAVVKLRAAVPERFAQDIRVGQRVTVTVASHPNDSFVGHVSRINPQVDQASRTFQVEALVPNAQRKLKAGSFARASVLIRTDHGVLCVPQEAVASFAGENRVFRVKDGRAVQYNVVLGEHLVITVGGRPVELLEIRSGLTGLEPVVVSGLNKLAAGVEVTARGAGKGKGTGPSVGSTRRSSSSHGPPASMPAQ